MRTVLLVSLLAACGCGRAPGNEAGTGVGEGVGEGARVARWPSGAGNDPGGLLDVRSASLWAAVPGTRLHLALWDGHLEEGAAAFAVARGTGDFGPARRAHFELRSRMGPVAIPSTVEQRLACARWGPGEALWLVQFHTTVQPEFAVRLGTLGAEVLRPFPHQAVLARMTAGACAAVLDEPYVRALLPFDAELKADRALLEGDGVRVALLVPVSSAPDDRGLLAARLGALGVEVDAASLAHALVRVHGAPAQLRVVASWPEVLHLEGWAEPGVDVDKARVLSGANFVEETLGLSGQGVRGEIMDGNVMAAHPDLNRRPILFHGEHSGDDSHGTSTTGLVFGDGSGRNAARGVLPLGQPIFAGNAPIAYNQVSRYEHTRALVEPPYEAVFQSNSWGSGLTTQYTAISAELDQIVFDTDLLVFNSMSNMGSRMARPQAWSKNVVSVGGVNHRDTLDTADDVWGYGASIGPASDGRIKPDLAHFWDWTLAPTNDGAYTEDFGGTSGSTPITAGLAGIFMQLWSQGLFGNPTPGGTVYENRPHFSTAKAMLINTASQWPFEGADADLGRMHQGWGRVDLRRMVALRNQLLVVDETDLLTDGTSRSYRVEVPAGTPELRATLTWADPPALPSAGLQRVNDLTLVVTAPSGAIYFGNAGLREAMTSQSGGQADTVDTVENVIVASPEPGSWTVEVRADELAQDGHVETAALDADYALVVSGIRPVAVRRDPPIVALTAPEDGASVRGVVTLTARAVAPSGRVERVRFGLPDGSSMDDDAAPFEVTVDMARFRDGPAQLTAVAIDESGATSQVAAVGVIVSNSNADSSAESSSSTGGRSARGAPL